MQPRYRADVDGLRAIAVGSVLFFHAWPRFLPGGFVGVDVFFVISGFLITGIIFREAEEGRFSYLNFYSRRLRRIGPALLTVILFFLIVGFAFYPYGMVRELAIEAAAGAGFGANFLFWFQADYFDALNGTKPLLHLWSLGVEEQFYLVWPTFIVFAVSLRSKMIRSKVTMMLFALVFISFAANIWLTAYDPQTAFYLLPSRLWQLAIGGVLAVREKPDRKINLTLASVEALAGLVLIALGAFLFDELQPYPGWRALFPTIGAVLVIHAGPDALPNRSILGCEPLRFIGLISYPIYLWHWPALVSLNFAGHSTATWKAVALVATVLAAYLTYRYVETPIRFSRKHSTGARLGPRVIFASLIAVALIAVAMPALYLRFIQTPVWVVTFEGRKDEFRSAYRYGQCFLTRNQAGENFGQECWRVTNPERPRLLLWGDSHAAHLYPGLLAKQAGPAAHFDLIQLTASACPPIVDLRRVPMSPNCIGVNEVVKSFVTNLKPRGVILAAAWVWYMGDHDPVVKPDQIVHTIAWLKSQGVEHVYVIGPVPQWDRPLPVILQARSFSDQPLPLRLSSNINQGAAFTEPVVRDATVSAGGTYISALNALCDPVSGCLSSVETEGGREPFDWDQDHLTTAASRVTINKIWNEIGTEFQR